MYVLRSYLKSQNKWPFFNKNHRFPGGILGYLCIFDRKLIKQLAFMLQFAALPIAVVLEDLAVVLGRPVDCLGVKHRDRDVRLHRDALGHCAAYQ